MTVADRTSGRVWWAVLFIASLTGLACSTPSAGANRDVSSGTLILPDASDVPTWVPDESWMAYRVADGDSYTNRSLRLVSSDGENTVSLGRAVEPFWYERESVSPSGQHIAYGLRSDGSWGPYTLWLATIDGRERHKVADDVRSHGWSPDGTQLAFSTVENDEGEDLWIMAVGDQGAGTAIQTATGVYEWKWSPDGSRIAYTSADRTDSGLDWQTLWASTRGGPSRQLAAGQIGSWKWSPDSRRLGYELRGQGLWTVTASTSADEPDVGPVQINPGVRTWDETWEWSPDGRWLIYVTRESGVRFGVGDLWLASLEGGTQEWLGSDVDVYGAKWSPAGDRLAFIVDDGEEDGSNLSYGSDDGDLWVYTVHDGEKEWVSGDISRVVWSPDGQMLAYSVTGPAVDRYHGVYAPAPLWVWETDAREPYRLVADQVVYARWSPASSGIAYWRWPEDYSPDDPGGELWLWSEHTNATGRVARSVHTGQPENISAISTGVRSWDWSPEGTYLAYRTVEGGVSIAEISRVELEVGIGTEQEAPASHQETWPRLADLPYRIALVEKPVDESTDHVIVMWQDGGDRRPHGVVCPTLIDQAAPASIYPYTRPGGVP